MTTDPLRPPAQAEAYVNVLGVDGAIEFLLAFGGTEIYLARNPQARSRVAALVGRDKAEALAVACEGLPRRVPLCKPWIARVMRHRGLAGEKPLPVAEIARRLHTSDVSVRKWLKHGPNRRSDDRQLPLF
jgi:hypothetical protein